MCSAGSLTTPMEELTYADGSGSTISARDCCSLLKGDTLIPGVGSVDQEVLAPLVRAATECPGLEIDGWQTTCLSVQDRRSVFRFAGIGHVGDSSRRWSMVLKVIRRPETADAPDADPAHWAYWPREWLMYAAGVPQGLEGGLRSPRCWGVMQPKPDVRWIWLEDLTEHLSRPWPLERYALAARHLGAFNGAYLAGRPLPTAAWLNAEGLRGRSADAAAELQRFRDPDLWTDPRLRRAFPRPVLHDLERLLADRPLLLAAMSGFPRTFCHLDTGYSANGNLAAVPSGGADVTVLFDWALAGYGAPGQDIANLVWSSFVEFCLDIGDLPQLEAQVLDSYLQGLADSDIRLDPAHVRRAYLTGSVLMFGLIPEAVDHALNESEHAELERYYGWPIDRIVEQSAEVTYRLLERAEMLRALPDTPAGEVGSPAVGSAVIRQFHLELGSHCGSKSPYGGGEQAPEVRPEVG